MDYEKEANSMAYDFCLWDRDGEPMFNEIVAWLRQHDVRLIRELSLDAEFIKASVYQRVVTWLERRAREIEAEIGEKP